MAAEFWIGDKLGRGAVGTSYQGMLKADRTRVVVKVISRRFHEFPDLLRQVQGDLRRWIGFTHPSVASTRAVEYYNDRWVILFDHALGEPLDRYLREHGALDARLAMLVIRDVALGLAEIHNGDLAVGDIRAHKIYFDGRHATLTDLGLARASCLGNGFGQFGMAFGHPAYLAPEVLQESIREPTPRADVYAMGILFYELLTGELPYRGQPQQVLRAHVEQTFQPPPSIAGSAPLRNLLLRMTAKRPDQRFPSAGAVVSALYQAIGHAPPPQAAQRNLMNTQVWRQQAMAGSNPAAQQGWSKDRVMNARPVGPDLSNRNSVTGRLPRQMLAGMADHKSGSFPALTQQPQQTPTPGAAPAAAAAAEPTDGVQVGNKLGRGPTGACYEARMAQYTGPVVAKVLSQKFSQHEELYERIRHDLDKAVGLGGRTIVPAFRLLSVSDRDVLVSERINGRTLREVLAERKYLPAEEVLQIGRDLSEALAAGVRRKLPHGDLRPEKVFLESVGGRARLADFGLCEASCLGANFGQIGIRFGHPNYLAPEVVQEESARPTFAADVYSLGVLLYECLTGSPPFVGETPRKTMVMHLETPPPPPPKALQVPSPLADLILRLLNKDPRRRPNEPADLVAELSRTEKQVKLAGSSPDNSDIVAEFDPSSSGAEGTTGLWQSEEVTLTERDESWDPERVSRAPQVGPAGLDDEQWQSEEIDLGGGMLDL